MTNLVLTNSSGKDITTSLIVAEVFDKRHDNVIRDIQNLECSSEFRFLNFEESKYLNSQGREMPMYEMTKDGFSFLVMGYKGIKASEFKEKFIIEFNKREALLKNDDYIISRAMSVLSDRAKLLEQQIRNRDERLKLQEHVIQQSAPKVQYFDEVLQAENLIQTNVIAKELGMSAVALNKRLHDMRIIYRTGNTWVLYQKYQNKGYTGTKTFTFINSVGNQSTNVQTYWTEKGREFIHRSLSMVNEMNKCKVV